MSDLSETFQIEVGELLDELESALLELEEQPDNRDLVERVFRALHTIKGNSTVVGFAELVAFTHEVETVFDLVRKGQISHSPELGNLALAARDQIRRLIEAEVNGEPGDADESLRILAALQELATAQSGGRKAEAKARATQGLAATRDAVAWLRADGASMPTRRQALEHLLEVRDAVAILGADLVEFIRNFVNTFYALLQYNKSTPPEILAITDEALEHFPKMIAEADDPTAMMNMDPMALFQSMEAPLRLVNRLKEACTAAGLAIDGPTPPTLSPADKPRSDAARDDRVPPATWRIHFAAEPSFAASGLAFGDLIKELDRLGMTTVASEPLPDAATLTWEVLLSTTHEVNTIRDVFCIAENMGRLTLTLVDAGEGTDPSRPERRVGEILVDRGDLTPDELHLALRHQDVNKSAGAATTPGAPPAGTAPLRARRKSETEEPMAFMRVAINRLNELVNMIGELVTEQARLSQRAHILQDPEMMFLGEELDRLSSRLRSGTMRIRMEPIGITFFKFSRMLRDLARDLGKKIELITEGDETELDKATIEKLNDPLVHLLRNSVDHGIETPEIRAAAGKPEQGTIRLTVEHAGGMVLLRIIDDGGGIDPEKLRRKAIEKKLIAPDAQLTLAETYNLIFLPGFSTAEKVSNVSGRGTGMDVVKRAIQALRGSIDIDSTLGAGSVFTLKLPLTMAIIEGLLAKSGNQHFIFPLAAVREIVQLTNDARSHVNGRNLINLRGDPVPYYRLRECFAIDDPQPNLEQVVVCRVGATRVGFVVDHVIGENQTVVKNLGRLYRDVDAFSGTTVLGDGSMALILDIANLLARAENATPTGR